MKIVSTFAVVQDSLFSVLFDTEVNVVNENGAIIPNEQQHEFNRLFNFWNDPKKLKVFFEENLEDLNDAYWDEINIEEAIEKTKNEATELQKILLEYAKAGQTIRLKNLSMLFKPLSKGKYDKEFEKDKTKVEGKKTWLRLYAIRVEANFFVVYGGAIKLRKTLNDRPYLLQELNKLEITRNYLLDEDNDNLEFFEIN